PPVGPDRGAQADHQLLAAARLGGPADGRPGGPPVLQGAGGRHRRLEGSLHALQAAGPVKPPSGTTCRTWSLYRADVDAGRGYTDRGLPRTGHRTQVSL